VKVDVRSARYVFVTLVRNLALLRQSVGICRDLSEVVVVALLGWVEGGLGLIRLSGFDKLPGGRALTGCRAVGDRT